jgi:hypothetical protein
MRACLAAWVVCALASIADAKPTVVLVETRDAPTLPTLAAQVEMHASQRAEVVARAERDADPLTYAERAAQLVAAGQASIVVWVARVDHGYLVFVAGAWTGRALTELVRLDADIGSAELERTVALKIAGLLDVLLQAAPARAVLDVRVAPSAEEPELRDASPVPRGREWRIEVVGLVAADGHQRALDGRAALGVSRAWLRGAWSFAPMLGAHWQPSGTIEGMGGRASITELGAIAAFEVGRTLGPIDAFARGRIVAAVLAARGTSADGRRGDVTVFAPYTGVELGVRRTIAASAQVGVVGGCDFASIHREFLIDGETVVDVGRIRLHVGLSLTVRL